MSDIRIRKVKVLRGKAKEEAKEKGLNPDDLVIVTGDHIEKIEGDPVFYLLKRSRKIDVVEEMHRMEDEELLHGTEYERKEK